MGTNLDHISQGGSRSQEHICHPRLSGPTCHKHTYLQLLIAAWVTEIYYLEWQQEASVQIQTFLWREKSWESIIHQIINLPVLPFHSHTLPAQKVSFYLSFFFLKRLSSEHRTMSSSSSHRKSERLFVWEKLTNTQLTRNLVCMHW